MYQKLKSRFFTVSLLGMLFSVIASGTSSAQEPRYHRDALILPHVEANEDFFTGLSLLNRGEDASEVRVVAFNENGQVVGEMETIILPPGARYISSVADIFGYEAAHEVSWLKVEYTGELSGFGLIGNDGQLTRLPLQREGKETLILPYVISGDGLFTQIYILNIGSDFAALTFTAYSGDGGLLKRILFDVPLTPGQKTEHAVSDLIGPEVAQETSWIKIETNGKIMGLGLIGSSDKLFSVPME